MRAAPAIDIADAVAIIDEERCIGCTLCMEACPVDAIVGAAKLMHTVIAQACTGCELCVPPCPVDCIEIHPIGPRPPAVRVQAAAAAERRRGKRDARLARLREKKAAQAALLREESAARKRRETVAKAVERARSRLADRRS